MWAFDPKILTTLKHYSRKQFLQDLSAGVIVGIVALPLAIAFAIASGVSPDRGLVTAVVAGFLISALGGSRVQIGGPTGAFVVIVYAVVEKYGVSGLQVATLMAGVILILMGVARLGGVIKFIPYPVTVGFTSGIAVIIFSAQIKDFFGLEMGRVPADFVAKWQAYAAHWRSFSPQAFGLAAFSALTVLFFRKISKSIPGSLIAIVLTTLAVRWLNLSVETIGSRFGELPHQLPSPALPPVSWAMIRDLISPATTIAILAAIESLLSAVIADGMIGGRHRSDTELIAQGIANLASPLFGGMPATGAIARTTANIQNGGRTPVAGIVHALTLLLLLLFLSPLAAGIPLACLAGILLVVAYYMSEWRSFLAMLRSPRSDVVVLVSTFGLTVLADLTVAIEIGMVFSAFLFMRRMAGVANVGVITREFADQEESEDPNAVDPRDVPHGVEIYEINGPFFFGAAYKFMEAMREVSRDPKVRIIRMRNVLTIDATGLHAIREGWKQSRKNRILFFIEGIHAQPRMAFERSGLRELVGEENFYATLPEALDRARAVIEAKV